MRRLATGRQPDLVLESGWHRWPSSSRADELFQVPPLVMGGRAGSASVKVGPTLRFLGVGKLVVDQGVDVLQ
jgi:hypothetical protein